MIGLLPFYFEEISKHYYEWLHGDNQFISSSFHYKMNIQSDKIECKSNFNLITFYRKQLNFILFIHDYLTQRQGMKNKSIVRA